MSSQYNEVPDQFREITPHEYAVLISRKCINRTETRGMIHPDFKEQLTGTLIHFHDGTGIAATAVYTQTKAPDYKKGELSQYGYITRFWSFGCCHEYEEISWNDKVGKVRLSHDHMMKCNHCGRIEITNSSD